MRDLQVEWSRLLARNQIQHPNNPFFTGQMPFLSHNQQPQRTEGNIFLFSTHICFRISVAFVPYLYEQNRTNFIRLCNKVHILEQRYNGTFSGHSNSRGNIAFDLKEIATESFSVALT